jgi:FkbM family methyltransferase
MPQEQEPSQRTRFFRRAARATPLLSVEIGQLHFIVETWDRKVGGTLFSRRGRTEIRTLGSAIGLARGLGLEPTRGTFLDIGANIGTTCLVAVAEHGFTSAVAIEPSPGNFRLLRANIARNGLQDRVTTVAAAASDGPGVARLALSLGNSGNHRVVEHDVDLEAQRTVDVRQVSVDELVEDGVIDPAAVGMVWLDTQGSEGRILAGARSLLAHGPALVFELHPVLLGGDAETAALADALAEHYTHVFDLGRSNDRPPADGVRAGLEDLIHQYARGGPRSHTDVLALRVPAAVAVRSGQVADAPGC